MGTGLYHFWIFILAAPKAKEAAKVVTNAVVKTPDIWDPAKLADWLNSSVWALLILNITALILFLGTTIGPSVQPFLSKVFSAFSGTLVFIWKTLTTRKAKSKKKSKNAVSEVSEGLPPSEETGATEVAATELPPPPPAEVPAPTEEIQTVTEAPMETPPPAPELPEPSAVDASPGDLPPPEIPEPAPEPEPSSPTLEAEAPPKAPLPEPLQPEIPLTPPPEVEVPTPEVTAKESVPFEEKTEIIEENALAHPDTLKIETLLEEAQTEDSAPPLPAAAVSDDIKPSKMDTVVSKTSFETDIEAAILAPLDATEEIPIFDPSSLDEMIKSHKVPTVDASKELPPL